MPKFLTGNALNSELEKLFEEAEKYLILISPYIKLHSRFVSVLKTKIENPKFEIIVVFGKNEDNFSKSMKEEDFNFFKDFPNIQILYQPNLHAKYYANEDSAILTSMNLYSFSQDNNIEAGALTKRNLINDLTDNFLSNVTGDDSFDTQCFSYFERVIDQALTLFDKEPQFESTMLGLSEKFKQSIVVEDKLTEFFSKHQIFDNKSKKFENNPVIKAGTTLTGFCIRTGKPIPFNAKKPFASEAFESWNKFKNKNYPEKYCHYSGEPSKGITTYAKPILRKNWGKATQVYNLK